MFNESILPLDTSIIDGADLLTIKSLPLFIVEIQEKWLHSSGRLQVDKSVSDVTLVLKKLGMMEWG